MEKKNFSNANNVNKGHVMLSTFLAGASRLKIFRMRFNTTAFTTCATLSEDSSSKDIHIASIIFVW